MSQPLDLVFAAISDPTRRAILVLLRDGSERNAGELAAPFPAISRVAVSKHIQVLLRAGLLTFRRDGRNRLYRLNDRPLAAAYTGWLQRFVPTWEASLEALRDAAEAMDPAAAKGPEVHDRPA